MTIVTPTGREISFASSVREQRSLLNLAQFLSQEMKESLLSLPCFAGVDAQDLIAEANTKLGSKNTKKVSDKLTAMLVIVGTRPLDHPELQVPAAQKRNIHAPCYASK